MLKLKGEKREVFGKKVKSLRKKDKIPAILYGPEIKNLPLTVEVGEFRKVFLKTRESALFELELDGKKYQVLVKEVQVDPLTDKIIHIDFYCPPKKETIELEVPIVFEGEAPAVKELGGVLVKEIQTIELRGLIKDLPKEIKVNLEKLKKFDDRILVKDLKIPPKVKILRDPKEIVALVTPPEKEEIVEQVPEKESLPSEERPSEIQKEKKEQKE